MSDALGDLTIGAPTHALGLTVFPLLGPSKWTPDVLTLDAAMRRGDVDVHELPDGPTIETLQLVNHADLPVLLLEGDMLIGGKANRALNATMLVPPHHAQSIPVSCVEVGRWAGDPRITEAGTHVAPLRVRSAISSSVTCDLDGMRGLLRADLRARRSNQRIVWRRSACMLKTISEATKTIDLMHAYRHRAALLRKMARVLPPVDYQRGAIFASPSRGILGVELAADADVFAALMPALVGSYGIDILTPGRLTSVKSPSDADAKELLWALQSCDAGSYPGVGLGNELRAYGHDLSMNALLLSDRLVYLSAFVRARDSRAESDDA